MTGPAQGSSTGKSWAAKWAGQYASLGKGPAEHLQLPAGLPRDADDLPDAAPPEQTEAGNCIGEAGEDLHVVVSTHREHGDPGCGQPVHSAPKVAVRLVEVVLLLDHVAREQHRIDLVPEGEVDGESPRGRPARARSP